MDALLSITVCRTRSFGLAVVGGPVVGPFTALFICVHAVADRVAFIFQLSSYRS